MFESILEGSSIGTLSVSSALICMLAALILGFVIAIVHMVSGKYSKDFVITLAILPLLVQVVIMMVNGNLGTSVAILGAFGLIRYRSMPGTSRELASIFFAMAVGLSVSMGHITYAIVFTVITSIVIIVLQKTKFGEKNKNEKVLKILIPESLDYTNVFDEVLAKYTIKNNLERVKTTNMGSMYELKYRILLKNNIKEKEFLDDLRVLNGNLNITLSRLNDDNLL